MSPKKKLGPSHKNSVTKAWLQFQEDIEAAMLRKPGGGSGLYKNLTDLMQDRMDQLDQVRNVRSRSVFDGKKKERRRGSEAIRSRLPAGLSVPV